MGQGVTVLLLEEVSRQKFRELWLREGDRNTGFFHKMVNAHKMRNSLCSFKINGQWMFDPSGLKEGVVNTFQNLLSKEEDWRFDCERLEFRELEWRRQHGWKCLSLRQRFF